MTSLPIHISSGVVPTVKINDIVTVGQIIAKKVTHGMHIIDLAQEFSLPLKKVSKTLKIKPGDNVEVGDTLAVKKGFFSMSEEKLVSRVKGKFSRYDNETGKIIIDLDAGIFNSDMTSPVDGTVIICDNDKIVIGIDKGVYVGRKGAGGEITGEAHILESASNEISLYYTLDHNAVDKIVVGRIFPRDLIIKCAGIGVVGIIGTEIRNEDIEYLFARHMQLPVVEVDNAILEEIILCKAKKFYLNSQTKEIVSLHA